MTAQSRFATCSYVEFDPSYGVPVRTTLGHPRFKLRYPLEHKIMDLAPDRSMFHIQDRAEFEPLFRAKLDRIGLRAILDQARAVAAGRTLVLLCFDKLWLPDAWCHRQVAAAWLAERTGRDVPELGRTAD